MVNWVLNREFWLGVWEGGYFKNKVWMEVLMWVKTVYTRWVDICWQMERWNPCICSKQIVGLCVKRKRKRN